MKRKNTIIISTIIYIIFILIIFCLILLPNIKNIKNFKKLSESEINILIENINNKYDKNQINEEYKIKLDELDSKYKKLIDDKNKKLDDELDVTLNNYKSDIDKIQKEIIDIQVKENKEFFANGLSKYYYELRDKYNELNNKKNDLNLKKLKEENELELKRREEINKIKNEQNNEIKNINNEKEEKIKLDNEKKEKEIDNVYKKNKLNKKYIINIIIGIIIMVLPIIYLIIVYNKLTNLYNKVKKSWSLVDIDLKERNDLIPNIVSIVKGYTKHEKDVLEKITNERTKAINASSKEGEINHNKEIDSCVIKIFSLIEKYPDLKANDNFKNLNNQLINIENKISNSRKNYNNCVLMYKNKSEIFPSNIVASIFNFKKEMFYEIDESERENVNIKL